MKTRVVVVEDHVGVRQMMGILLEREGPYERVGEAGTGFDALRTCRKLKPDLVILDLVLPELNGLEVLRTLRAEELKTRFLVYSGVSSGEMIREALRARPHGFVHKTDQWSVFWEALRMVSAGGVYLSPFAASMMDHLQADPLADRSLSARERTVLQMIAEGMSNKEMADRL